jgi:predicted AAA+ superfamily ATPase
MSDFIVGSPARNDDFWFRENFVADLWEALEKHNVLLLAPRRTGKTSVMYHMLDNPKEGWLVIHLNVEDLATPADFVVSLINATNRG